MQVRGTGGARRRVWSRILRVERVGVGLRPPDAPDRLDHGVEEQGIVRYVRLVRAFAMRGVGAGMRKSPSHLGIDGPDTAAKFRYEPVTSHDFFLSGRIAASR